MVRGSKKSENGEKAQQNPEAEERKRIKKLAFSKNLLSQTPSKPISSLNPTKTLLKHHGSDILKKSQRKNKFLFSFPGLLAPTSGGKLGELRDLGTKNPILYIDFPQGRLKLFGTIVYPKNRYLTLQFARGGKNVVCEDYFDNMIVFSDAWWIGSKEENPEEVRLEFPKELDKVHHTDYDFKGGAGAKSEEKAGVNKVGKESVEIQSPKTEPEEDASEDSHPFTGNDLIGSMDVTPVRHSARTAGKNFRFAEPSSGEASSDDDSVDGGADIAKVKKEKIEDSNLVVQATVSENTALKTDLPGKIPQSSSVKSSKKFLDFKSGPLVQASITTLFEKAGEKKSTRSVRNSPASKVTGEKSRGTGSKRKSDKVKDERPRKKRTAIKKQKAGTGVSKKQKASQDEDDDIEDFSSESEDNDGSDEDWGA